MATVRCTFQVPLTDPYRDALQNVKHKSPVCFNKSISIMPKIRNTLDSNIPRTKRMDQFGDKTSTILPSYHEEGVMPCLFKNDQIGVQHDIHNKNSLAKPRVPFTYNANSQGFDITNFLEDKHILITGGTGFLGKVLVEKILRIQPKIGQIYLLIKAKDISHAKRRVHEELMQNSLFSIIQSCHGEHYEHFMHQKITPLVGDVGSDDLGMNNDTIEILRNKVNIIVHSAATTTFDERYDIALNINTQGAHRVMEFSKSCSSLQLLMHVSTAFVNGGQSGVVHEQAFRFGYSIANERLNQEQDKKPDIDFEIESNIIHETIESFNSDNVPFNSQNNNNEGQTLNEVMKALGMARAKHFGWQDTYAFTKSMGEMLIDKERDNVPTVIVRPSVVESTYREPFPGWIEGNRMMDPIIISYGKGQLRGFLCDPNSALDVVPADMVINAMLAAMAKHASKPGLEVYHLTSSSINPLFFSNLSRIITDHYRENPFLGNDGKPINTKAFQFYQNIEEFMEDVSHAHMDPKKSPHKTTLNTTMLKEYIQRATKQAAYLASIYRPYTFYTGKFDSSKTEQLYHELSNDEKILFGFNVNEIDWEAYLKKTHIPGLRKHVLKGRGSNM